MCYYENSHSKIPQRKEQSYFDKWFSKLDPQIAAKIVTAITRLEQGNFSNVKSVGEGVFEYRIQCGSGYRLYFGEDVESLIVILAGGSKDRQRKDIGEAKERWRFYKLRKLRRGIWS